MTAWKVRGRSQVVSGVELTCLCVHMFVCVRISVPDPQTHIQVSRDFKDRVVEPILKVTSISTVQLNCHMTVT